MKVFLKMIFALLATGCVTSAEPGVDINNPPSADKPYTEVLRKSTRDADVISNFETHYMINVTVLSPEFRTAFSDRLQRVFLQENKSFEEASSKIGFFVSISSSDSSTIDITNQLHWTIFFQQKDQKLKPIAIKRLNDKIRWQSFFDYVTKWSYEYLLIFDSPSINPNAPELVEKPELKLTFANAEAQTTLVW